jgi:hypothetical protein
MAIVHIAIFDAINSIAGGYKSYTHLPRTSGSIPATIITAAHDTLVVLYPSQENRSQSCRIMTLQKFLIQPEKFNELIQARNKLIFKR